MTLREMQERLLAWAGAEERQPWLLAARARHFAAYGEPHDEDKSYETRMNGMLEAYVLDFRPDGRDTVLEHFLRDGGADLTTDARAAFRELGRNRHGVFEVRRIRPGTVELEDVLTEERFEVGERRAVVALAKGDIVEARLLPHGGELHFSTSSLYHPREVRRGVLKEAKRRAREAQAAGLQPDAGTFAAELARMALRWERYRNVRVESIYDFEAPQARNGA